jgi:5-methylcytosine-specific restriction endonuclease McrA
MGKRLTFNFIKDKFEEEDYILVSTIYKNCDTKLSYICKNGHNNSITWSKFRIGQRCPKCNFGKPGYSIKIDIDFVKIEFYREGYILLSDTYVNAHTKLNCKCPSGHSYSITWNDWTNGYRCKQCFCDRLKIGRNEAAKNSLYADYRCNAIKRKRNYEFLLTKEEFLNLTSQNCFYCGSPPSSIKKNTHNNGDYVYNGIDRIDNSKGYVLDNCVPCCKNCNRAKMSLTQEEFKTLITNIYDNFCIRDKTNS